VFEFPKKRNGACTATVMLNDFLLENQSKILAMTAKKTLDLTGVRPSSAQLAEGLPIFYKQVMNVLQYEQSHPAPSVVNHAVTVKAADDSDELTIAKASAHPKDTQLVEAAARHGSELLRLGYTLSHVVHAYGAMCQAITELATTQKFTISSREFHDLNRCLDIAIAGAVTEFASNHKANEEHREIEHLGFLAHELRNALTSADISIELIKKGTVGFTGNTGRVFETSMKRLGALIDRSLTEVRLRVDPKIQAEKGYVLQLVDQISLTAGVEARAKKQTLDIKIDPALVLEADQPLIYSALSNLILNAIKYSRNGANIQIRAHPVGDQIVIEVEDECGGLSTDNADDLFKSFVQKNENRNGLGLGLTIAQRAVCLNHGSLQALNLPGKGCIFKITLPNVCFSQDEAVQPAA
jgi:signal transduction histidine kinase